MTSKDLSKEEAAKLPAVYDYGDDVGSGFEGTKRGDFLTPILDIVQDNSKEVKKRLLPGVQAGDLIIRAFGEIYHPGERGLPIVPIARNKCFMVWKPIESGGGIVDRWKEDDHRALQLKAKQEFGKIRLEDGNDMVETYEVFALFCPQPEVTLRVVIPFASTKINAYKGLMTKAQNILVPTPDGRKVTPPLFAHRYLLKPIFIEKGQYSWWGYGNVAFDGDTALDARLRPDSDLYLQAKVFKKQIDDGLIEVDTTGTEGEGHEDAGGAAPREPGQDDGDEAPF